MMPQPLIIAHRGSSGEAPENTMKAFELALEQGADGIELDVFMTADGKVVVTHDENLKRLSGHDVWTRRLTLAALKKLDMGEGERIPTLDEVLDRFGRYFKIINIEIKSTGVKTDGIERAVIGRVMDHGVMDNAFVSSFNFFHLLRLRLLNRGLKRGYLIAPGNWISKGVMRRCEPASINLDHSWLSEKRFNAYQRLKIPIWVWTVNARDDMERWADKDVQAIITNYPARLHYLLGQKRRTK